MEQTLTSLRRKLEQEKGQAFQLQKIIQSERKELKVAKQSLLDHQKAKEIVRIVGLEIQKQLQYHISDITSLALESVFDNPYELKAEFVERRNKLECDLKFTRDGHDIDDPMSATGVGAIDVAGFALRIALWSMENPKTHPVIILDEPFKHLKGETANRKVLFMLQELSRKLGIQIIMVSDERVPREDIIEAADKTFRVSIHKGISKVEEL